MLNVSTKQNTKSFNEHCLINNKEEEAVLFLVIIYKNKL